MMRRNFIIFCLCLIPIYARADALDLYMRTFDVEIATADNRLSVLSGLYDWVTLAKEREQSLANRMLGALSIGATSIGGMELMSGMAEQAADADAERNMKNYLATFKCGFGQGLNIKGGDKDIVLPTSSEIPPLVAEYRQIAENLKIMKEQLDMQPGIESELIIDASRTGLYDDVGLGKTSGAFTSLYRALTDEKSADAAAWNDQKSAAQKKTKTGGVTAGAGVVGGAAGNMIINRDKK